MPIDEQGKKVGEFDLSLHLLLTNPAGSGTSNVASRKLIIAGLDKKYEELLSHNGNKFKYNIYRDNKKGTRYIFHFKIPTESIKDSSLTYDVIIEVNPNGDNRQNLLKEPVKVFSNSPSFSFTYAYVLYKRGNIPEFLEKGKLNKIYKTKAPNTRNPIETFGFEKTIYYTCKYIYDNELYIVSNLEKGTIIPLSEKIILASIKNSKDKLAEYNEEKKKSRDEKRKEKEAREEGGLTGMFKKIKSFSFIKKLPIIGSAKVTKKTKTIKRIKIK